MESVLCIKTAADKSFRYAHKWDQSPDLSHYLVHTHEEYELLIFLQGDVSFIAEGAAHPVVPFDAIITRPGEMHQIFHHSQAGYERILLTFNDAFFVNYDCSEYRRIFTDRDVGRENIIHAGTAQEPAVLDVLQRIERYINERGRRRQSEVVIRCAVIELLHLLSRLKPDETSGTSQSEAVHRAAAYINQHLAGDLSLELLSKRFFVSKYHLCRIFKSCTGMTVGQYITRKRIVMAKGLYHGGCSLSEAAIRSGFADYSAFYKACVKELGKSPKAGLKR